MTDPDPRAPARRLAWRSARIAAVAPVTPRVRSVRVAVTFDEPFRAGQHVDLRLTAPDGYQAQRSYSIASPPSDTTGIELMIEGLDDGEVSNFFETIAGAGDAIELRGPIGGSFVWAPADRGPVLLAGGGSGVVPLLSMLRHRAVAAPGVPMLLIYSARTAAEVIARDELEARARDEPGFDLILTLTREDEAGEAHGRRVDAAMVGEALGRLGTPRRAFVCGANPFVEAVANLLLDAGLPPATIRTERFGG